MDNFARHGALEQKVQRAIRKQWFVAHLICYLVTQVVLVIIWRSTSTAHQWFWYPMFGWAVIVVTHAYLAFVARTSSELMVDFQQQ